MDSREDTAGVTVGAITQTPKWTPGPWRVFTAKGDTHKIIGIGEMSGEGIADCGFGIWRGGSAEALANAHLIAAAPELAAFAESLLIYTVEDDDRLWVTFDGFTIAFKMDSVEASFMLQIEAARRAALSRARGEQS